MNFVIGTFSAGTLIIGNATVHLDCLEIAVSDDRESHEVAQECLWGWELVQEWNIVPIASARGMRRLDKDRVPLIEQVHSERQSNATTANHQYAHGGTVAASGTEGKKPGAMPFRMPVATRPGR